MDGEISSSTRTRESTSEIGLILLEALLHDLYFQSSDLEDGGGENCVSWREVVKMLPELGLVVSATAVIRDEGVVI